MSDINNMTPEEIRADIARKRGEMSRKVDAVQDRFQPDNLKAEARSLAQEVVSESAETIKDFVRTNSAEMGRSLVDSFKRNPIPSALILGGLGWMIFNSTQSSQQEGGMYARYDARYDRYDPSYDRNFDRGYYTDRRYGPEYGYAARGYGRRGRALNAYDNYGEWDERAEEMQSRYGSSGDNGQSFADRAGDVAHRAGNAVAAAADKVTDTVKGAVDDVSDSLSDQADRLARPVVDAGSSLRQNVDAMGGRVADTREQWMDQAADLSQDAQYQMMRAQEAAARALDGNLLTFGALALLAGAAIGLALPATRREREYMGEYSDRLVERTQQMAEKVGHEVQQVAENVADDVAPKLQQAVAKVSQDLKVAGEDVKQASKEVSKDLVKGMEKAGESAKNKVQEATGVDLTSASGKSGWSSTSDSPNT